MNERAAELQSMSDKVFRRKFAAWLDANYPASWRQDGRRPFRRLRGSEVVEWIEMLCEGGWRCPAWPAEHGGLGLSFPKQVIYQEELERASASRVIDLGEVQLGPTLILHGSAEQQQAYLPSIRAGQHIWSQGYSEPNAGSDLASLSTAAVRDGDAFRVTGQKIWTTHADESTHMFALVRTAKGERKQNGITFLLIAMDSPGITVRAIRNIAGEEEFCEVFFDDVRVSVDQAVGEIGAGWTVAKALLGYERVWTGSPALCRRALGISRSLMERRMGDGGLADRYAELAADVHDVGALYRQTCDQIGAGVEPGPEVSILKILASDLLQRISEFNIELAGYSAGCIGSRQFDGVEIDAPWQYYMARPTTIFAGSNEIQKNILSKALLGLPAS